MCIRDRCTILQANKIFFEYSHQNRYKKNKEFYIQKQHYTCARNMCEVMYGGWPISENWKTGIGTKRTGKEYDIFVQLRATKNSGNLS